MGCNWLCRCYKNVGSTCLRVQLEHVGRPNAKRRPAVNGRRFECDGRGVAASAGQLIFLASLCRHLQCKWRFSEDAKICHGGRRWGGVGGKRGWGWRRAGSHLICIRRARPLVVSMTCQHNKEHAARKHTKANGHAR